MTYTLKGLKGIKKKFIEAEYIKNHNQIETALQSCRACTSSGAHGAINIHIDDEGKFRCKSMRWCETVDEKIYDNIRPVKTWAKRWLTLIK